MRLPRLQEIATLWDFYFPPLLKGLDLDLRLSTRGGWFEYIKPWHLVSVNSNWLSQVGYLNEYVRDDIAEIVDEIWVSKLPVIEPNTSTTLLFIWNKTVTSGTVLLLLGNLPKAKLNKWFVWTSSIRLNDCTRTRGHPYTISANVL